MVDSTARTGRGAATRREIINVARRLFSEYGYRSTGIADIQEATGLTKGAFYHHFRSKEDLALAALDTARQDYNQRWVEPLEKISDPGERLNAGLDRMVELNERPDWQNCPMLAMLTAEVNATDGRLREAISTMRTEARELWQMMIAAAQKARKANPHIPPVVGAEWIMNTLCGHLLARKAGNAEATTAQLIGVLKRAILGRARNGNEE